MLMSDAPTEAEILESYRGSCMVFLELDFLRENGHSLQFPSEATTAVDCSPGVAEPFWYPET
uniref:Uncharacterized protein n=1 Tax=Rhizophora mucronata TaxID=61149 RepID=A0A2P2NRT2_RHIMU